MTLAIWASGPDVPPGICVDARLHNRETGAILRLDTTYGQAGWDIAFFFSNLHHLAEQLSTGSFAVPGHVRNRRGVVNREGRINQGQVTRLGILAHGNPGQVYVNGQEGGDPLTVATINGIHHLDLDTIRLATSRNALILFLGCSAGQGAEGTLFLQAISRKWPGRKVVGFTTVGWVTQDVARVARPPEHRAADQGVCREPGMRDTSSTMPVGPAREEEVYGSHWDDLWTLPWASDQSLHAKVAQDGGIIRDPDSFLRGMGGVRMMERQDSLRGMGSVRMLERQEARRERAGEE